jgi:hypothetical protein
MSVSIQTDEQPTTVGERITEAPKPVDVSVEKDENTKTSVDPLVLVDTGKQENVTSLFLMNDRTIISTFKCFVVSFNIYGY